MTWQTLRRSIQHLSVCAGLTLSGCTVELKDGEFCADAGKLGASCYHLLSDAGRDIPKAKWDDERFGMICEKPAVFANLKAVIEALCENTHNCSYEQKQQADAFFRKALKGNK